MMLMIVETENGYSTVVYATSAGSGTLSAKIENLSRTFAFANYF